MTTYRIVIDGTTLPGFDAESVRPQLASLIKSSEEVAGRFLSGKSSTVKRGVDQATGLRYVEALRRIGAACHVEQETLDIDLDTTPPSPAPSPKKKGPDEKFCTECGAVINAKAELCPRCGVRQHLAPVSTVQTAPAATANPLESSGTHSRIVAAVFAILLGSFGIHKFYLGNIGMGIVYLLFCWSGIPLILGFIEGIVYLCTSDQSFAKKYG